MSDIKNQFIKKLSAAEWMSEDVRKLGIDKGTAMLLKNTIDSKSKVYAIANS